MVRVYNEMNTYRNNFKKTYWILLENRSKRIPRKRWWEEIREDVNAWISKNGKQREAIGNNGRNNNSSKNLVEIITANN